ncbi:LysE family translocator [Cognatishimia sp. SS12]|uniref:LysE family translocator n=1 Tax=Cognatishimia sp. SS12 TaxID=2979465 RepID=UPI00232D87D8|nr:LysE family translocator [Cognatishimia sp. SS12]MDC0737428.1 LysE family translocator [Cognatishimia sp. SS12]
MELTHIIAFNLTLLAAIASPGPAMLVSIKASLTGGFRQGVITGAGLGLMAAVWTSLALLGLGGLLALFPWAYLAMKIAGAIYLIWIAVGMWRTARAPLATTNAQVAGRQAFVTGLSVNLANPKSVLFASAVLLVIFPQDISLSEKAFVVANHLAVELICYTGFALLLSTAPARDGYLRLKPIFDRIAAAVLGALGLRLLLDRS